MHWLFIYSCLYEGVHLQRLNNSSLMMELVLTEQIYNLIERQYKSTYDRFAINFWRDLDLSKKELLTNKTTYFPQLYYIKSFHALVMISYWMFYQNELNGTMDFVLYQTFKSVCNIGYRRAEDGKLIHQYNSTLCRFALHNLGRQRQQNPYELSTINPE